MRAAATLLVFLLAFPSPAFAKNHLWKFTEVFSNAAGNIQFIEMFVFDPAGTAEWEMEAARLWSEEGRYVFPNDLPMENTYLRWLLVATPDFAALPGAPTPDYIMPPNFFDPVVDELRYRILFDILPLPQGAVPVDGINSFLRDGSTAPNSPTNFAGETGSIDLTRPCSDGEDNDGDGLVDLADPSCQDVDSPSEESACQDGLDNDGSTGTDFDGGASIHGPGGIDPQGADPDCIGKPWRNSEAPECNLGFAVLPAFVAFFGLRAWRPRRTG